MNHFIKQIVRKDEWLKQVEFAVSYSSAKYSTETLLLDHFVVRKSQHGFFLSVLRMPVVVNEQLT